MTEEYIRTNEISDFLCSLAWTKIALDQVEINSDNWKWVVLSLHSTLQGALVCHLTGTANLGALERGSAYDKWFAWLHNQTGDAPRRPRLADLKELSKRLQDQGSRLEVAGDIISLTQQQKLAIELLHELRNQFTHFQPQAWSIEVVGLRPMLASVVDVVSSIAKEHWPFRHADEQQLQLIEKRLIELRQASGEGHPASP